MPSKCGTVQPNGLYSLRCMAMNHRRYIAWFRSTARVLFGTFPERHTGRSLRFRRGVVPFNHTGYIRNVAGGRLPPLHTQPLCAYCSYNEKRRTAPHPPPMAVPLPRRGRFWRSTSAPIVPAMRNVVLPSSWQAPPCLSLWERWPSVARTERVNVDDTNERYHSINAPRPSQSPAVTALPKGEPRGCGLLHRMLAWVMESWGLPYLHKNGGKTAAVL